jgi:hypothetical protein
MDEYRAEHNGTLRVVNGEPHLGFYQDGEWVDLGRAVLAMTEHHEGTGAYKIEWTLK